MKILLAALLTTLLCFFTSCGNAEPVTEQETQAETTLRVYTAENLTNSVTKHGQDTFKTAIKLSDKDAKLLSETIFAHEYGDEIDMEHDYSLSLEGWLLYYNSELGVFNQLVLPSTKLISSVYDPSADDTPLYYGITLSEDERLTVNALLERYDYSEE